MASGSGSRAVPNATGTFAELPLAHALAYVRAKRLSGVLDLRAPGGRQAWVVFWRGSVASASTNPTIARFGVVAYELGLLDAVTVAETAQEAARIDKPHAELLLTRGHITRDDYARVFDEQIRRRVQHLFTYPPTTMFLFREGRSSADSPASLVDVLAPLWRGVVDEPPVDRVREVLAAIGDRFIRVTNVALLERAELAKEDAAVVASLLAGKKTLAELRAAARGTTAHVDLVVYVLLLTRCGEVDGPGIAPAPSGAMWAHAKPTASGELAKPGAAARADAARAGAALASASETPEAPAAVRTPADLGAAAIRTRAAALDVESPFEALGIHASASTEAARAAYLRLRRTWHPDRVPPELEEVREEIGRIFDHMTEAHRLLTDPKSQKRHSTGT